MPDITANQSEPLEETRSVTTQARPGPLAYRNAVKHHLSRSAVAPGERRFIQIPGDGTLSIQMQIGHMAADGSLQTDHLHQGEAEYLLESQIPTLSSIRLEWDALRERIHVIIDDTTPTRLERQVDPPSMNTFASRTAGEIPPHRSGRAPHTDGPTSAWCR